jgi:hypothetical protein
LGYGDALRRLLGVSNVFLLASVERAPLDIKILWFVLIMVGGNIIMSLYLLLQPFGLPPDEPASALFRQKAA